MRKNVGHGAIDFGVSVAALFVVEMELCRRCRSALNRGECARRGFAVARQPGDRADGARNEEESVGIVVVGA